MLPRKVSATATPTATATATGLLNSPRLPSLLVLLLPATLPPPSRRLASLQHNASLTTPAFPAEEPPAAFVDLLKARSRTVKSLLEAGLLHSRAIKTGLDQDDPVRTGLLNVYAKCGSLNLASKLFDEILQRDVLAWTILISGHSRAGQHEEGLNIFAEMLAEGPRPNRFTLSSVLKCCVGLDDLRRGESIHGWAIRNGIEFDVALQNSILDVYAKCGAFASTKNVFQMMREKDTISWNIMIDAYVRHGDIDGSMKLFRTSPYQDISSWNTIINGQMEHGFHSVALQILHTMVDMGPGFNQFTFSTALVLAGRLAMLDLGKQLHCQILRIGYEGDAFIRNALIDMYSKCGNMEASSFIFGGSFILGGLSGRADGSVAESISWSAMVAGYVQNGMHEEALELLCKMSREGVNMDQFTLTSIAAACSDAGLLEQGKQVHCIVEKLGCGFDIFLASAITDMYAKCGSLEDARNFFDNFHTRNIVLWTSIIGSYASHGQAAEAIRLFEKMLEEKIIPNEISFVHVLSACAHAGLVETGHEYFKLMQEECGIVPSIEHFTCMVDLLGRAGLLKKAKDFIHEKNISHYPVVWRALLSACRVHNNIEMASMVSEQLVQLEPCDSRNYILLSNVYATKRKWEEASRLRRIMHERGVRKRPAQSWIQLKNKVLL